MKVVFKLPVTVSDAEIISAIQKYNDIVEWGVNHPCFNPNQELVVEFSPHGNKLTYAGERNPMQVDGAYSTILSFFGNKEAATTAICYYETSDKRLMWHETLYEYLMSPRATFEEVVESIVNNKCGRGQYVGMPIEGMGALPHAPAGLAKAIANPAVLAAGFTTEEQRPIKRLMAFIKSH